MIKTIVAIATNVSASFDKRGSHSGSYRLRGSDPHPKIWIWRWWPWSCFSYRPTHQPILIERTTDPASSITVHKGKAGEREKEGGALGQVEVSRHKESSSLFLWLFFLCFAAFIITLRNCSLPGWGQEVVPGGPCAFPLFWAYLLSSWEFQGLNYLLP